MYGRYMCVCCHGFLGVVYDLLFCVLWVCTSVCCIVTMCACVCVAVDFVCDHPYIRAISFVGSDRVGKYIYERGSANGKRVQSNMVT